LEWLAVAAQELGNRLFGQRPERFGAGLVATDHVGLSRLRNARKLLASATGGQRGQSGGRQTKKTSPIHGENPFLEFGGNVRVPRCHNTLCANRRCGDFVVGEQTQHATIVFFGFHRLRN
jgi:hypothetical protein